MKQPIIHSTFKPVFAQVKSTKLGAITSYYLNDPKCDICKIEWLFPVGTKNQDKPLVANACANLLLEGTIHLNSRDFSTRLDELGAYFNVECGKDFTTFTLHVLTNQLKEALTIVLPILNKPTLSEVEFANLKTELKQDFEQNLQKGSYVAQQKLMNSLFPNHPYGKTAKLEDFDLLELSDIKKFANQHFINQKFTLYLSGNSDENVLAILKDEIGKLSILNNLEKPENSLLVESLKGVQKIKHQFAQQDSLKLGQIIPNYSHKDFSEISIVNTILGGYFGSRLMQNIREEKGWTYGISSSIVPSVDACYLIISSDILQNKGMEALDEIKTEILSLHHELVPIEELNAVKSYLKGNLLRSFDGVFEQMDKFISVNLFGLTQQHYLEYMDLLDNITPEDIQNIAQKYFKPENLTQILVQK